jgi:hypothetical protein
VGGNPRLTAHAPIPDAVPEVDLLPISASVLRSQRVRSLGVGCIAKELLQAVQNSPSASGEGGVVGSGADDKHEPCLPSGGRESVGRGSGIARSEWSGSPVGP